MWVPTEIDKAPAHRPEGRNGLLLGVWQAEFSSFVVKKLCVCPLKSWRCLRRVWMETWTFILDRASLRLASKAIRTALEGLRAGASALCNTVHVHTLYESDSAFFSQWNTQVGWNKSKSHYQATYLSEIFSKKGRYLNASIFTFLGASWKQNVFC